MTTHTVWAPDGAALHVRMDGSGFLPTLMLCNSLGTDLNLWAFQMPEFAKSFRIVRYDRRGHGHSGLGNAPHTMETLGRDALAIMDALDLDKVHWCGLSMGGMVGQWLAANAPHRIDRLVLSNTSAYFADKQRWNDRIKAVREKGLAPLADSVMALWFTREFRESAPDILAAMVKMFGTISVDGYIASCEAVRDMDHRDLLSEIEAPTLIIVGKHDQSTPLAMAEAMHEGIDGSILRMIEAAHISNVERPAFYTHLVEQFLTEHSR